MKNPGITALKYFGGMSLLLTVSGLTMVFGSNLIETYDGTIISGDFFKDINVIIFCTLVLYITKRITGTKIYISTPWVSIAISVLVALMFTQRIGTFALAICCGLSFMVNLFSLSTMMSTSN